MGRTYYDDFRRYGGRGSSYNYQSYLPYRESPKERDARRAREDRDYHVIEDRWSYDRDDRHDQSRRDEDSKKRKFEEGRQRSNEIEDSSKHSKVGQQSTLDMPTSSDPVDIPSGSLLFRWPIFTRL